MILELVCIAFGVLGVAFGLRMYHELWKWARQCQNARIVIAHKQKVKMQATMAEFVTWANALESDEASRGRVIYRLANASVAIARPGKTPGMSAELWRAIKRARNARKTRKLPVR